MHEEFLKTVNNSDYWLVDTDHIREVKYKKDGSNVCYTHEIEEFIKKNQNNPVLEIINQYRIL